MRPSPLAIALATALVLPTLAVAIPLPNPPFADGGFVSPSTGVLRAQDAIHKLIDAYVRANDKCDRKALAGLHAAYPPAGDGNAVQAAQDKWFNCTLKPFLRIFEAGVDKVVATGTPACLDKASIQSILASADYVRRTVRDHSYCDGDAANPDSATQMRIPDSAAEVLAEQRIHEPVVKTGIAVGRCYAKATRIAFKTGGTLSSDDLDKLEACTAKAVAKGQAAVQEVADTFALPACVSVTDLKDQIAGTATSVTGITALVFCAE